MVKTSFRPTGFGPTVQPEWRGGGGTSQKQSTSIIYLWGTWVVVCINNELVPSAKTRALKWYFYNSAEILPEGRNDDKDKMTIVPKK